MAVGELSPIEQLRNRARWLNLEHMLRTDAELAEVTAAARSAGGSDPRSGDSNGRPFDVGDVVQLKSGGHPMVVTDLRCARTVAVAWSENGAFMDCDLHEKCLQHASVEGEDINIGAQPFAF